MVIWADWGYRFTLTPADIASIESFELCYDLRPGGVWDSFVDSWVLQAHGIFSQLGIEEGEWRKYCEFIVVLVRVLVLIDVYQLSWKSFTFGLNVNRTRKDHIHPLTPPLTPRYTSSSDQSPAHPMMTTDGMLGWEGGATIGRTTPLGKGRCRRMSGRGWAFRRL